MFDWTLIAAFGRDTKSLHYLRAQTLWQQDHKILTHSIGKGIFIIRIKLHGEKKKKGEKKSEREKVKIKNLQNVNIWHDGNSLGFYLTWLYTRLQAECILKPKATGLYPNFVAAFLSQILQPSPTRSSVSTWKSSVADLKSVVKAHFDSKSSIKWLSLMCHSVTQPLGTHVRAAPLSILRETQADCFIEFLGKGGKGGN